MQQSAVVRSSILADFRRLSVALDLDTKALLRRAGIDARSLDDPDRPVPMRSVVELFELAALTSGVEDFGLRLGILRGLPDLGPLSLMLREQAIVRDALRTLVASLHMHSAATFMHLEEGREPILSIEILGAGTGSCRQAIDSSIAGITHILRWLLGEDWNPASLAFKHARPHSCAAFERYFRCPISFLREFNGIVLRQRDLQKRLPASSTGLKQQAERYLHSLVLAPSSAYKYQVTQVISLALPRGDAKAETIARYLGTNRQTLNRRLARSNVNYSGLLNEVRRHTAAQYLLGSDRPLSDVAGLVGFNSLAAFTRWFHKSFRCTPSDWRRRQRRTRTPR